jgi:hypothetical protein
MDEITIAVKPAAGPDTLNLLPLKMVTKIPPIAPVIIPENNETLQAIAMPKHNGKATKNTTIPALKSANILFCNINDLKKN